MEDRLAMWWEGRCGAATAWMTMLTLLAASLTASPAASWTALAAIE